MDNIQLNQAVPATLIKQYKRAQEEMQRVINQVYTHVVEAQTRLRKQFTDELNRLFNELPYNIRVTESTGYFYGHVKVKPEFFSGIKQVELFSYDSNNNSLKINFMKGYDKRNRVIQFNRATTPKKIFEKVSKYLPLQEKFFEKFD